MYIGWSQQFNYTGNIQTVTLNSGRYKLECYGAQGTGILNGSGGNGGYAVGEIDLYKQTQVFIVVGGTNCYNGGATNGSGNGGGATHIATQTGVLSSLVNNKDSVLIVAGGGGGGERVRGGHGGGLTGGTQGGTYSGHSRTAGGGTQTSGGIAGYNTNSGSSATNGSFGQGGSGNGSDNGPGGGGGWYGGGGVNYAGGAGGGSSYIAKLQNASTTTGANTGNGYAKITCITVYHSIDDTTTFNYTGNEQYIDLAPGAYKLECWGASGGDAGNWSSLGGYAHPGNGGYTSGTIYISEIKRLYIQVGSKGSNGGYNGGGYGSTAPKGGGASDVRLRSGAWNNLDGLKSRIIVAGGGGSDEWGYSNGGHGGNLIGGTGTAGRTGNGQRTCYGGSQTAGGSGYINGGFGYGGYSTASTDLGGCGGGGWYGGGTNLYSGGGGGGSSYAAGYAECDSTYHISHQEEIVLYNVVFQSGINTGDGQIKITAIGYYIMASNCNTDITSYVPLNQEQLATITIPKTLTKDGLIYYFNKFKYTPNTVIITQLDKYHYQLIIPANANYNITINAIFDLPMRLNTDIFKDSKPQTIIEYESLLDLLENK